MKILIFGATGFMGRNLFEHFTKQGHDVWGTAWETDSYHDKVLYANLKNEYDVDEIFGMVEPDVVIQAAATTSGVADTIEKPYIHVTDNAVMNSYILRAAYKSKVKHFVFLSCSVMYQPSERPMKESDWNPGEEIIKQYFGVGNTKVFVERQCEFYSRLGMKCTAVRHSNTYGPYDKFDPDHSHVLGASIRKVAEAKDSVEVWGTGEEKKDLIYVDDVVRGIEIIIQKQTDVFERVNMSSGEGITINGLVEAIMKVSNKVLPITHNTSKPSIPVHLVYDSSYMKEKYGWVPYVSLEEGLRRTIQWFKENYKGEVEHKRFQ
jgi:nucleoside-diphosphate-sugar epimerase